MSNLVPTPRVDKNGVTVVRHVKPGTTSASKLPVIPQVNVPTIQTKQRTMRQRTEGITELRQYGDRRPRMLPSKIGKWLSGSRTDELERLDEVIDGYREMPAQELHIIKSALSPLAIVGESTEFIHEMLALRRSFCGEWASENNVSVSKADDYIMGLRESFGAPIRKPLQFHDARTLKEAEAVMRFTFELDRRFPREAFRPAEHAYIEGGISYLRHREPALVALLREYPERADDLLEFAVEHRTSDPQLLRAHVEHDGPLAVSTGYL